jgi:hypothetical protein
MGCESLRDFSTDQSTFVYEVALAACHITYDEISLHHDYRGAPFLVRSALKAMMRNKSMPNSISADLPKINCVLVPELHMSWDAMVSLSG